MAKIIGFIMCVCAMSLFFFPVTFAGMPPSTNSKMVMAAIGLFLFIYNLAKTKESHIDKRLITIIVFALLVSLSTYVSIVINNTLDYTYVPLKLEGAKIVIACSNKKRGLGDSKYNERRSECETALEELQKVVDIKSLGELTEEQFEQNKDAIKDEVRVRRAHHAVYENQRTIQAVDALQKQDLKRFGELMNASHVSLRDDYEVTGIELDTLVEEAWKVEGVIGSRMTGAGFGGCTVSIVEDAAVDRFIESVGAAYKDKIGYAADFYVVQVGSGPCRLDA